MTQLIDIRRVEVGPKHLTARVKVSMAAPLMTSEDLEGTTRVYRLLPHIIEHVCLGDGGQTFKDVMGDTEVAHLLEHVTVEILAQTDIAGDVPCGRTFEVEGERRTYDIEFPCPDDALVIGALSSAVWILQWAYTGGGEPAPDVEATVRGLVDLVESLPLAEPPQPSVREYVVVGDEARAILAELAEAQRALEPEAASEEDEEAAVPKSEAVPAWMRGVAEPEPEEVPVAEGAPVAAYAADEPLDPDEEAEVAAWREYMAGSAETTHDVSEPANAAYEELDSAADDAPEDVERPAQELEPLAEAVAVEEGETEAEDDFEPEDLDLPKVEPVFGEEYFVEEYEDEASGDDELGSTLITKPLVVAEAAAEPEAEEEATEEPAEAEEPAEGEHAGAVEAEAEAEPDEAEPAEAEEPVAETSEAEFELPWDDEPAEVEEFDARAVLNAYINGEVELGEDVPELVNAVYEEYGSAVVGGAEEEEDLAADEAEDVVAEDAVAEDAVAAGEATEEEPLDLEASLFDGFDDLPASWTLR